MKIPIFQSRKIKSFFKIIFLSIKETFLFLYRGFRAKKGLACLRSLAFIVYNCMEKYVECLQQDPTLVGEKRTERLKLFSKGLHQLMPPDPSFSYSIIIPTALPDPHRLKRAVESALEQTAPDFEIILSFEKPLSNSIETIVKGLQSKAPDKIKIVHSEQALLGAAEASAKQYLFIMSADDWVRPDLLLRYEQSLRLLPDPTFTVISSEEYPIRNTNLHLIGSHIHKSSRFSLPFQFDLPDFYNLLIPKSLWNKAMNLKNAPQDLVLRLDLAGASFQYVAAFLYGRGNPVEAYRKVHGGIDNFALYCEQKQLDWTVSHGMHQHSLRAIPKLHPTPSVHVIMPYKDQKELTLKAIKSVLKQEGIGLKITAVDNNSSDASIADELSSLGVEVMTIQEPFNYSRLNNLAVKNSKQHSENDLLLFLNNDIELDPGALQEMARWAIQPKVGIVGCRLHYPNGLLQHGGLELDLTGPLFQMTWSETEKKLPLNQLNKALQLKVCDAVTAACAMMRRTLFIEVNGFDEIWYPIAFSDTNLCLKLAAKGFISFYTPYASGIHHESISRSSHNIEDFEASRWLHLKHMDRYKRLST